MIAEEIIAEIRSRADIVVVIGQHVQLKKAGRSWKGLCPFHGEKTPSFNVMPDKGFFHCFGCQQNGDVFKFVMLMEGKSFPEAAEQLGARFGVAVPKLEESPELKRARGERVAMLDLNKHAAAFFREVLADPKRGEPGRAYLAKRGVGDAISETFQLGYAPADWSALADYLRAKGCDLRLADQLGLIHPRERAGGHYDVYRERLVCPIVVPGGDIFGFSARFIGSQLRPDGSEPAKYINSPESLVYKKNRLLFGLAQAREGMQKFSRAVLVEGNFDVITLHQAEFTEVVAPLGTALTADQVQLLKRLTPRVVLLYDGDRAGYKATMNALQTCVEADVEVLVARKPGDGQSGGAGRLREGADPDSVVAGGGAVQLRKSIDRALGGIEFFCAEVWGTARNNADARTRAMEDLARLLARIANPLKREFVIDTFAKSLDVETGVVRAAVSRAGAQAAGRPAERAERPAAHPNAPAAAPASDGTPRAKLPPTEEIELVKLVLDHPSLIATPEADNAFWLLTDDSLRDMYREARAGVPLLELVSQSPIAEHVLSGRHSDYKDPRAQLVAMIAGFERRRQQVERTKLARSLADAKRGAIDPELVRLQAQLAVAKARGDQPLVEQLESQISSNRKQAE